MWEATTTGGAQVEVESGDRRGRRPRRNRAGGSSSARAGSLSPNAIAPYSPSSASARAGVRNGFGGGYKRAASSRSSRQAAAMAAGRGLVQVDWQSVNRSYGSGTCGGLYDPVHRDNSNGHFAGYSGGGNSQVYVPPSSAPASYGGGGGGAFGGGGGGGFSAGDMSQSNATSFGNPLATVREMCHHRR
jgi:hypothetical protein